MTAVEGLYPELLLETVVMIRFAPARQVVLVQGTAVLT